MQPNSCFFLFGVVVFFMLLILFFVWFNGGLFRWHLLGDLEIIDGNGVE